MVNGCHSCLAIVGIFMKAQSPGEYLNPSGRLICNVVTLQDNRDAFLMNEIKDGSGSQCSKNIGLIEVGASFPRI